MKLNFFFVAILFFNTLDLFSQSSDIQNTFIFCDSTIINSLKGEIDFLIENPIGIKNSVIDSSTSVIIAGKRVYSRKSTSNPDGIKKLLYRLKLGEELCAYITYAHAIDYLITQGFDMSYDYTASVVFDKKTSSYIDIRKTKEYYSKSSYLFIYKLLYEEYKRIDNQEGFLLENEFLLQNLINLSSITRPKLIYKILKNDLPMVR